MVAILKMPMRLIRSASIQYFLIALVDSSNEIGIGENRLVWNTVTEVRGSVSPARRLYHHPMCLVQPVLVGLVGSATTRTGSIHHA